MTLNYSQICTGFIKDLPQRQRDVLLRRFALAGSGKRATLESIGKDFGVTRERVRQIENDAFLKIKPNAKNNQKVFQYLRDYLKKEGQLKREDLLLEDLGKAKAQNQVYFLLTLGEGFNRVSETENFHAFWTINKNSTAEAEKTIASLMAKLKKTQKPLTFQELAKLNSQNAKALNSILEASKQIQKNKDNVFGLREWPEINPRGVKDKAYLALKKEQKPLHFREVAKLLDAALPQTVHNELIKDARFVLVGRGLYGLKEWGHQEGVVKDVIFAVLKTANRPLSKEEILKKVLAERMVKENTVLLNLSNRKHFLRTPEGLYKVQNKEA